MDKKICRKKAEKQKVGQDRKRKTIYSKYEEAKAQKEVKQLARRHSLKAQWGNMTPSVSPVLCLVLFVSIAKLRAREDVLGVEESS